MRLATITAMKGCRFTRISAVILLLAAFIMPLHGQKVAEANYAMRQAAGPGDAAKINSHWVLYSANNGGYRLESDVYHVPNGVRVTQREDLDNRFTPTAVMYELYYKSEGTPAAVLSCSFANKAIVCSGRSDKGTAPNSEPFNPGGPFWLLSQDFSAIDMGWNVAGALNMARAADKKSTLKPVMVSGGAALVLGDKLNVAHLEASKQPGQTITVVAPEHYTEWDFSADEGMEVTLIGNEPVEIDGTRVSAQHYTMGAGDELVNAWITNNGLLVKLSRAADPGELVLTNFKQYARLIPELKVESRPPASAGK